jgi:hypothetical protein
MRTSMNSSISSLLRARSLISWPPGPIRTAVGVLSLLNASATSRSGSRPTPRHRRVRFQRRGRPGRRRRRARRRQVAELRLPPRHEGQEEPACRTLRVGEDQQHGRAGRQGRRQRDGHAAVERGHREGRRGRAGWQPPRRQRPVRAAEGSLELERSDTVAEVAVVAQQRQRHHGQRGGRRARIGYGETC